MGAPLCSPPSAQPSLSVPVLREGAVCFISPQPRPSPPDKGLRGGGGPEKLLTADNSLCWRPPPIAEGRGRLNSAPGYSEAPRGRA